MVLTKKQEQIISQDMESRVLVTANAGTGKKGMENCGGSKYILCCILWYEIYESSPTLREPTRIAHKHTHQNTTVTHVAHSYQ